jgi:hypothetical protein
MYGEHTKGSCGYGTASAPKVDDAALDSGGAQFFLLCGRKVEMANGRLYKPPST